MMTGAPFFDDIADLPPDGRCLWLMTDDGIRLRAAHWPGSGKGTVFLLPGRTEYIEKYAPPAAEFCRCGWDVLTLDWRGQGLSDRVPKQPLIGHVRSYAEYQRDIDALIALAAADRLPQPYHVVSHSMGGLIALRALHDGKPFRSAVFSAPMWGLRIAPMARHLAMSLSYVARLAGRGASLAPSMGLMNYVSREPFEGNVLTSDAETYGRLKMQIETHPELALGGPSLDWLLATLHEMAKLTRRAPPDVPALTALGTSEQVVDAGVIRAMMTRWPRGKLDIYEKAEHEVMMEIRRHRVRFFNAACGFLDANQA